MRFKLHIQCNMCECGFDLSPVQFQDRPEFACPNCGKRMNESLFSHLRAGLTAFAQIPDTGGGFSFTITGETKDPTMEKLRQLHDQFQEEEASAPSETSFGWG